MTDLPIDHAVANHGNRIAFEDGTTQVTYSDLPELLSDSVAGRKRIMGEGQHVAWCPRNDLDAFLTFWALLKRGCVACPMSYRLPSTTRVRTMQRIDAQWLDDLPFEEDATAKWKHPRVRMPSETQADALVQGGTLILTSGSTGDPKAVMHTMAAHVVSATGAATAMPLGPGDRWLWSLPLFHVSGLSILVRCAVAGATVVGLKEEEKTSARYLGRQPVTHLSVVATQLRRLMEDATFPYDSLRTVLLGGSQIDARLVDAARRRGVNVLTTYGLTETASQVTTSTCDGNTSASGRPLPGREVKLSGSGEILVRSATMCRGYYESGRVVSILDEQGWLHTGDRGAWTDDGELQVHGRIDNMFISGGENIYPEQIERVIRDRFDVEEVVVVPRTCESFGARPVAFVRGTMPQDWSTQLREHLAGYEIPDEILDWPEVEAEGEMKVKRLVLQNRVT
ncbi:MAG: o-succinylbenzoate--CoA ligase [Planctomycetota bacterium]